MGNKCRENISRNIKWEDRGRKRRKKGNVGRRRQNERRRWKNVDRRGKEGMWNIWNKGRGDR